MAGVIRNSAAMRKGLRPLKLIYNSTSKTAVDFRQPCFIPKRSIFGKKKDPLAFAIDQDTYKENTKPEDASEVVLKPVKAQEVVKEKEKFIPITRRSVIRHLMQEQNFLSDEEKKQFEKFSLALDSAVVNRYHNNLQELKSLFDPIDPDKDTITTRDWTRRQRLDNEFWLLQKLSHIMEKANFHKIPKQIVEKALEEKHSAEGVMVSVNPTKYDILDFWALGKEKPMVEISWMDQLKYKLTFRALPQSEEYYKRVVVAVRLKKDDKLILKAFKEVPTHSLEKLLPDGKIKMSKMDKMVVSWTIGLVGAGVVGKIVTLLAHIHVEWTVILAAIAGLTAARTWTAYKNRKNAYLVELTRMLYFRNIANNRGLLALLVDRAEDELFKEMLLSYTFLLANRPPSERELSSEKQDPEKLGGLTSSQLNSRIEDWVLSKTKNSVAFDSSDAVCMLKELGILSEDPSSLDLHVLSLQAAIRNLPITPQSVIDRAEEFDQLEGYDRQEPDEEYIEDKKKRKAYGWF